MYYLIEHNRKTKQTKHEEYQECDYLRAQQKCFEKELRFNEQGREEMEVVIFEANSLDDLKKTHSRYFTEGGSANALKVAGAVGLVALAIFLLTKK